jgi:AcrR family transcriptional regulator
MKKKPEKVDRRVRRTQRGLRDALIELILERGWDAVTVRDVCEAADVGRSTFYLHYADKENLLLSGFDELQDAMAEYGRGAKHPFAFAQPLLDHALGHERLFRAMVGRQSGQQMQWRFRDMLVTLIGQELGSLKVPAANRASTACFLAGGFMEQLLDALDGVKKGADAGVLAGRFTRLAMGAVGAARTAH